MANIAARLPFSLLGRSLRLHNASGSQLQAVRGVMGADHDKSEPTASPWVKVLERPADEHGNRSEVAPVVTEGRRADSLDTSEDVPEKNPDTQPQAPIDPEVLAGSEANPSVDSVRHMAGKLNEAVGGSYDFPKTGGASVREMASEIGDNISEAAGVHRADPMGSKADQALGHAADRVADGARSAYDKAKEAVTGSTDSSRQ